MGDYKGCERSSGVFFGNDSGKRDGDGVIMMMMMIMKLAMIGRERKSGKRGGRPVMIMIN